MARITNLIRDVKSRYTQHTPTECTYYVLDDGAGNKILQLDTYGSPERQIQGKVSQTIQFSPDALQQLKRIIEQEEL